MKALFEKLFYEWPALVIEWFSGLWLFLGVKPVVLGSDLLVYILILGGCAWFALAMRREYWRTAFRQVSVDRLAVFCFGVLCMYGTVGLLDTMHYREVTGENKAGGGIVSVLDRICRPLIIQVETTYSSPFATHSFSKTTTLSEDGTSKRVFKKLAFGGKHLEDSDARNSDVIVGFLKAAVGGLLFGFMVFGIGSFLKRKIGSTEGEEPPSISMTLVLAGFFGLVAFLVLVPILLSEKYHIFGTDKAGADVFFMAIKSVRTGLVIGTLTTLIVTPFAILMGVMAGYFGGWVDDVIQYIYTTLGSIPSILLIAAAMLIFQLGLKNEETIISADKRLVYLCIILGITSWAGLCRLLRAEVLKIKEIEYVQAADSLGVSRMLTIVRHLVPNVMHIILINIILRFSGLVLTESVLTYIGIGVDPSMSSWGNMINQARMELARDPVVWWSLPAAFIFMFGLVLPANLFGDAVRDALDPRLRTR